MVRAKPRARGSVAPLVSCARELLAQSSSTVTVVEPPEEVAPAEARPPTSGEAESWLTGVRTGLAMHMESLHRERRRLRMARRWLAVKRAQIKRAKAWLLEVKRRVRAVKRLIGPAWHILEGAE